MGTEVLRPQDCLIERLRVGPTTSSVIPRRKPSYTNSNSKPSSYRRTVIRPEQPPKRREPTAATAAAVVVTADGSRSKNYNNNNNTNNLTIGSSSSQVTILKRGESLNVIKSNKNEILKRTVSSTGDLIGLGSSSSTSSSESRSIGPDPELVPKQIRITDLKSSTTVRSHHHHEVYAGSAFYMSPSPSALPLPTFSIKKEGLGIVDDSATKDLRRLLRLD